MSLGLETQISLGALDARRDWGYAGDYVRAMWLMLQQDEPGDYVIASGQAHSVGELVARLRAVGLDWEEHVRVDESLKRGKAELYDLVGDATKAASSSAGRLPSSSRVSCTTWWTRTSRACGHSLELAESPRSPRGRGSAGSAPRGSGRAAGPARARRTAHAGLGARTRALHRPKGA